MRRRDALRRHGPRREPLPRILIVCEGKCTEKEYFEHVGHVERIPTVVKGGYKPKKLVEVALELKRVATDAAKRDPNLRYDEVWCVFDVDDHPAIGEAKRQAQANGISVGISNPCFELWLLLHFQDQRRHIERDKAQRACKKHLPGYEKHPPCEKLLALYNDAARRAAELDKWHELNGKAGANPSTGVYKLVEKIRSFRKATA